MTKKLKKVLENEIITLPFLCRNSHKNCIQFISWSGGEGSSRWRCSKVRTSSWPSLARRTRSGSTTSAGSRPRSSRPKGWVVASCGLLWVAMGCCVQLHEMTKLFLWTSIVDLTRSLEKWLLLLLLLLLLLSLLLLLFLKIHYLVITNSLNKSMTCSIWGKMLFSCDF